jgi:hypothetical protein
MKHTIKLLTALLLAPLACYSEPPANNTETVPVKKSSPQNFDDEDAPDPIGASAKTEKSVSMASAHLQVANVEDPQSKQARRNGFGVDFIQLNGTIGQRISYSGETLALLACPRPAARRPWPRRSSRFWRPLEHTLVLFPCFSLLFGPPFGGAAPP